MYVISGVMDGMKSLVLITEGGAVGTLNCEGMCYGVGEGRCLELFFRERGGGGGAKYMNFFFQGSEKGERTTHSAN